MPAFAIAHIRRITMNADVVRYLERIDETLRPFNGVFRVHGGQTEVVEGEWRGDLIVIEFPDLDTARAWYRSPAYRAIVRLRTDNSEGVCLLVDGVTPDHRATDILTAVAPSPPQSQAAQ